jgi:Protein of unknown function (DUF1376)
MMPPARWRDWYPHKIDKWRGSLTVQGMSDGAYRGYHNLIMSQWESSDGMLPCVSKELARLSCLFARWDAFKDEILANFQRAGDRLFNPVQYSEWRRAREIYEKKARRHPDSGRSLAHGRTPDSGQTPAQAGVMVVGNGSVVDSSFKNDLSLHAKILCETVGVHDMIQERSLHALLDSYVRHHDGSSAETAGVHMAKRWSEYQRAGPDLEWVFGSAYKFFMSGTWDKPESWRKRNGHTESKTERLQRELDALLGGTEVAGT